MAILLLILFLIVAFVNHLFDSGLIIPIAIFFILYIAYLIAKSSAESRSEKEKENRVKQEERRKELEYVAKTKVSEIYSQYNPPLPLVIIYEAIPFKCNTEFINKEITFTVNNYKQQISTLMHEYTSSDAYKNLRKILLYSGTYTQKYDFLSSNFETIQKLKLECDTLYAYACERKIEIINEDDDILLLLKNTFSSILDSKKHMAQGSEKNNIDIQDLLCKDAPKELSQFKYKYLPASLFINGFYFCFFSNVILVFDSDGCFSTALDPTAMSIKISTKTEHALIRNGVFRYANFVDVDSKKVGEKKSSLAHKSQDGGSDGKYQHDSQNSNSYDDYEYGIINIAILEYSVSFTVSSQKSLSNFRSLRKKYIRKCNHLHSTISDFLYLIKALSGDNAKDIAYLINSYQNVSNSENYFCKIC